jgi:hypothetical protein
MEELERRVKEQGQQAYDEALRDGMTPEQAEALRQQIEREVREQEGPRWEALAAKHREELRIAKALHERGRFYYEDDKGPDDSVH